MATIETRHHGDGSKSYRVKIRLRGGQESETFDRKTDAKEWAARRRDGDPGRPTLRRHAEDAGRSHRPLPAGGTAWSRGDDEEGAPPQSGVVAGSPRPGAADSQTSGLAT
jgi:hypothetical protein